MSMTDNPEPTVETDAEQDARWAEEAEQARDANIEINRGIVHQHLRDASTALRLADRAARRLSDADLYDVEFVESRGGQVAYVNARAQIDVAIGALHYIVPAPEETP